MNFRVLALLYVYRFLIYMTERRNAREMAMDSEARGWLQLVNDRRERLHGGQTVFR